MIKIVRTVSLIFLLGLNLISKAQISNNLYPGPVTVVTDSLTGADSLLLIKQLMYKSRLDALQKNVALSYNADVQKYIDLFVTKGKQKFSKMLGLSQYYFPIYEKIFSQNNIPDEIKYLSIVESSLDPHAVSRSGATGPWQFMYTTAKGYGLNINNWVDERKDPVVACNAAAAYMRDSYAVFGDWLLAIASYNCGKGNVTRAIEKAGGANDFWSIKQYLPLETQNYIPAFIATVYLMNNYKDHDILPQASALSLVTDVIEVDKYISLKSIAEATELNLNELSILNPSYTKQIINGTHEFPKPLVIPAVSASRYGFLYDALNNSSNILFEKRTAKKVNSKSALPNKRYAVYKVKAGDTLSGIAKKFNGVTVSDIKGSNKLKNSGLQPGMILRINKG